MNTKTICQLATLAVSIPAGMALRGAMRAVDHNQNNPSPEKYKPPIQSAIFGAVLGMVIQTVPYIATHIARTTIHDRIEQNSIYGKTQISHVYTSDYVPRSPIEAIANLTTVRGLYTIATESFNVPQTVVQFKTSYNDDSVRVTQAYKGFIEPNTIQFANPLVTTQKEQLGDKEKAKIVAMANYSLAKK